IYTLLLTSGSRVIGRGECLSKWVESLMEGIRAIKQYGGADVGDRTMLDSLVPAAKALQRFITDSSSPLDALKAAVEPIHLRLSSCYFGFKICLSGSYNYWMSLDVFKYHFSGHHLFSDAFFASSDISIARMDLL
uniref:DhaL domain-containing protein n=1 Tax=Amphimedon queenslandica TaxID=400682 RepID=A0A1X7UAK5_AMPQE